MTEPDCAIREIWKFALPINDDVAHVTMPMDASILCVQVQHGDPYVWALVRPDNTKVIRRFCLYGTGEPIYEYTGKYIGTVQLHGGRLVLHVFEEEL